MICVFGYFKSFVSLYGLFVDSDIPVLRRKPRLSPAIHQNALNKIYGEGERKRVRSVTHVRKG